MTKSILILILGFPLLTFADTAYTVRKGDTLLSIADRELGITNKKDPRRYQFAQRLREMNPHLSNPNSLETGVVLTIPDAPKAVPSAKTSDRAAARREITLPAPAPAPAAAPEHAPAPPPPEAASKVAPEAAAEAAPESHAKADAAGDDEHSDFLVFQPRVHASSLEATDEATHATAKLTSKSGLGFDLQYGKILSEKWHVLAQLGYTTTQFKDLEAATGSTIDHLEETQKSFALGAAYEISHALHFDVLFLTAERTFIVPGAVAGTWELKGVLIPGLEANLSWDFLHGSSWAAGASLIAEGFAGAKKDSIDYKSAVEPVGALYWKSNRGHDRLNYRAAATFKNGRQHTSVSEQKENATVFSASLLLPL